MKRKSICILLLIMSILSVSCSNTTNITEDYVSPTILPSGTDITTKGTLIWELIESQSADINNDGKDEEVNLYTYERRYKICIDDSEYVFEFNSSNGMDISVIKIIKFISLANNQKGLLLGLMSEPGVGIPSEGDTPAYWYDYSFMVIGYDDGEFSILLDGINMPFNKDDNFKIKYLGEYILSFEDSYTGFFAEYAASLYKSVDDSKSRLETINDRGTSLVSNNYFNIRAQDTDFDGIDEIIASKYIPGLYHADALGIVEYKFAYQEGYYKLSEESLLYDGVDGFKEIKKMELQ